MRHMTAAEASRNFSRVQSDAEAGPVVVTHHGKPRLVVLSAEAFEGLGAEREGARAEGGNVERRRLDLVLDNVAEGFVAIGGDWRFRAINRAAELYLGRPRDGLIGRALTDAFPVLEGTEAQANLRRAMEQGELVRFAWRSVVHPGRRIEVQAFPVPAPGGEVGVVFSNVGERERLEAELRAARARVAALERALAER